MWSQAVFHSPRSRTFSIRNGRLDRVAEDLLEQPALGVELGLAARVRVGERRAVAAAEQVHPAHERTRSARAANAGASADFISVSPVLPSLPASGTLVRLGERLEGRQARAQRTA